MMTGPADETHQPTGQSVRELGDPVPMAPTEIHPKVAAAGIAGAATIIIVWIAETVGLSIPPEVASAFTALIAFGAGYWKSSGTAP